MKRLHVVAAIWLLIASLAGCGADRDLGGRFRAERALWEANAEVQRLSIRPELVTEAQWRKAVDAFSSIPETFKPKGNGPTAIELRAVEAHALLAAARIYGTLGDSLSMLDVYTRIEAEYKDLPVVTGEVAFARGRLAENRSDWPGALSAYQDVLTRITPRSGDAGVAGAALELPLRIARLRVVSARDSSMIFRRLVYRDAQTSYEHLVAEGDTLTALDARAYLSDVAADQREWGKAASELRDLEKKLAGMNPSPKDPGSVRYALAQLQSRSRAPAETLQTTLRSLIETYPKSPFALQSQLALAFSFAQAGNSSEALKAIDQLEKSQGGSEDLYAQGLLLKAQILDRDGRWTEAQQVLNALPVDHPLSEAALLAPVETVKHYERIGDKEGVAAALEKAEAAYRDFLNRYPTGPVSISAQEKLARTLAQEKRYDLAMAEFLRLGEALSPRSLGATYFVAAAQLAVTQLGDTTKATEILDRTASIYADHNVGRWASEEAARLRKVRE